MWWDWTTPGALINKNFPWAPAAHSHNGLLEAMLQLGVIGGVLVIAIHVRLIVRAARIVRYYRGAVGLFPLTYAAYVLMSSINEPGIYYRRAPFLIYVVLLTVAARGRRDVLPLEPPAVESRGLRRS